MISPPPELPPSSYPPYIPPSETIHQHSYHQNSRSRTQNSHKSYSTSPIPHHSSASPSQEVHSYSTHQHHNDPLPHWTKTNAKFARYASTCQACGKPILIGSRISYQFQFRRFVHEHCSTVPHTHMHHTPVHPPHPPQEFDPIHDPLAPGSPLDALSASYRAEAVRWVQFHAGTIMIPGIHCEFSTSGLEKYLRHRSKTNKNLAIIESRLKKMGELCGFILCNSKYQQPSLQYQRLRSAKATINRERREAGLDASTNEAVATGNFAITRLLAGFDVRSMNRFRKLHPIHQELIAIHTTQHAKCVRFGLFGATDPTRGDVRSLRGPRQRLRPLLQMEKEKEV